MNYWNKNPRYVLWTRRIRPRSCVQWMSGMCGIAHHGCKYSSSVILCQRLVGLCVVTRLAVNMINVNDVNMVVWNAVGTHPCDSWSWKSQPCCPNEGNANMRARQQRAVSAVVIQPTQPCFQRYLRRQTATLWVLHLCHRYCAGIITHSESVTTHSQPTGS